MQKFFYLFFMALMLNACAQTPEQSAAYRQFGMQMLSLQAQQAEQAQRDFDRMQQMHPVMRQPVNTYCYKTGNAVNCTSQ